MPIKPIDYSKSVIYKIQSIHDNNLLYIGSTTDFTRRKSEHKKLCKKSKQKVYLMIRENGGWDCFNMIVIKDYPCENKKELLIEEDNMMRQMKTTLNDNRAYLTDEERQAQQTDYQKKYHEKHKEELNNYNTKYYETNKEEVLQQQRENYHKKKQEAEAQQILEELWLCREREIIRNISIARDMDYNTLMAEFGSKK